MDFNFELILFYVTLGCGLLAAIDIFFFAKRRSVTDKIPVVFEYARSLFPIFLLVFLLRSFLYEPFRIPSGSLKPTLLVGDFVLVNKFTYGIRLPVIQQKILAGNPIKRGDIVVFHYPLHPSTYMIKRVIGVPGDKISYINKTIYVNGKKMPQKFLQYAFDQTEDYKFHWGVEKWSEDLSGVSHKIFKNPSNPAENFEDRIVPEGEYFMMGDNRDNSEDSRSWGFVPDKDIVGKAVYVWFSWIWPTKYNDDIGYFPKIRWNRLGMRIK